MNRTVKLRVTRTEGPPEQQDQQAPGGEAVVQGADVAATEVERFVAAYGGGVRSDCSAGAEALAGSVAVLRDPDRPRPAREEAVAHCVDLVRSGCLSITDLESLKAALEDCEVPGGGTWDELLATAISGADGATACDEHPLRQPDLVSVYAAFWNSSEELRTIRDFARARMASPWAVLGCVLARILTCVPPTIRLEAVVGAPGSLNFFVALVGPSGAGKGVAAQVAAEVVLTPGFYMSGLGSGEGLTHVYTAYDKETKTYSMRRDAALFYEPEVDVLAALLERSQATLSGQLRKAWMGEDLTLSYAAADKAAPVPAHAYRACVIVGAQPERSEALFRESDGGLPQRFLFMPATDPGARDPDIEAPPPIDLQEFLANLPAEHLVGLPDEARDEIRARRLSGIRGDLADELDSHRNLLRMKVAAALAFLHRRTDVDEETWRLAGMVLDVSDETRAGARRTIRSKGRDAVRRRAEAAVEADQIRRTELAEAASTRNALLEHLGGRGWVAHNELRKRLASNRRKHFDLAMSELVASGQVLEKSKTDGQPGTMYRLKGQSHYT